MTRFGATILDAQGLRLTPDEVALFRAVRPFGFILFARNIDTPDQVRALCDDLREAAGHDALITIDQEGGRVQRLRPPHWRDWPAPLRFVQAAGAGAGKAIYLRYRLIAAELHALGIDSNCAPMVDVARDHTHEFLRDRCLGVDPQTVAELGFAAAQGMLDGGVLPVLKHIPGHGRAVADSHFDLPRVDAPLAALEEQDFAPFRALRHLPMAMTAHIAFTAIDGLVPATLSAKVMGLVREQIGFENLIMTDDIAMKALQGDLATRSQAALAAGCDVVLHCNGTLAERAQTAEAAGAMADRAQARAQAALAQRRSPDDIDIPAALAQLEMLQQEAGAHG